VETEKSQPSNKGKTEAHGEGPQHEDNSKSLLWLKICKEDDFKYSLSEVTSLTNKQL